MIALLQSIPRRAAGAAVLAAGPFAAGWVTNGWCLGEQIAGLKSDQEKAARSAAVDQVKAVERARTEEQRRTAAQTEIANAATKGAETARADARTTGAVADQLRARVADLVRQSAAGNPTAAGGGEAAGDSLGVLADMLSRADQRAGVLVEYAGAARVVVPSSGRA